MWREFLKHVLLCAVIACAVYLPTVLAPYARHDDYMLSLDWPDKPHYCDAENFYKGLSNGRPFLVSINECVVHELMWHYPGEGLFVVLRVLNLACLILAFSLLSFWLARVLQWSLMPAVAVATLLMILPGQQFQMAQGLAFDNTFALPMVLAAAVVLMADYGRGRWFGGNVWRTSASVLLLVGAFLTYQTHTLFFFAPALIALVLGGGISRQLRWAIALKHLWVYLLASVFYAASLKIMQAALRGIYHFPPSTNDSGFHVNWHNILQRIAESAYMPKGLNLWFVTNSNIPGKIFIGFIVATAAVMGIRQAVAFIRGDRPGDIRGACGYAVLVTVIYFALQSPQILHGEITYYRVLVYYSMFVVVLVLGCVQFWYGLSGRPYKPWLRLLGILMVGFLLVRAGMDTYNCFAKISLREMSFLETGLQPMVHGQAYQAVIIRPIGGVYFLGDEHGQMTSYMVNGYGLEGMVKRVYQRQGVDNRSLRFQNYVCPELFPICRALVVTDENEEKKSAGRILVDMNVVYKDLMGLK